MRKERWQPLMWEAIEAARVRSFEWGTHDCVLCAAKIADAISDGNYVERARHSFSWANEAEAQALLSDNTLQQLVESVLGPIQRWTALGQGDLLLVQISDDHTALGIHDGTQAVVAGLDGGIVVRRMAHVLGGWRVE